METPPNYQLLATFITVAHEASFTKAAKKLGIGKGTVSRAIASLEKQLGTELLHRTTHAVALSTAGTALYERTAPHLLALAEAVEKLPERAEEPSGVLRLTAPNDFGLIVLPEVLAQFSLRYPQVRVDMRLTNAVVDLVADGFDLAIRSVSSLTQDSTLTMRRLGIGRPSWYAAPNYLLRRGRPKELGDPRHDWILHPAVRAGLKFPKDTPSRFLCDDMLFIRNLAREGSGICLLPGFVGAPDVREGLLEKVPLPDALNARKVDLALIYPSSGQIARKVTAFRDLLFEWNKKFQVD